MFYTFSLKELDRAIRRNKKYNEREARILKKRNEQILKMASKIVLKNQNGGENIFNKRYALAKVKPYVIEDKKVKWNEGYEAGFYAEQVINIDRLQKNIYALEKLMKSPKVGEQTKKEIEVYLDLMKSYEKAYDEGVENWTMENSAAYYNGFVEGARVRRKGYATFRIVPHNDKELKYARGEYIYNYRFAVANKERDDMRKFLAKHENQKFDDTTTFGTKSENKISDDAKLEKV